MSQIPDSKKPSILSGSIYDQGKVHGRLILPGSAGDQASNALGLFETSEFAAKSRPFMVSLMILESAFTLEYIERVYFVRAPDPHLAAATCAHLWTQWEKIDAGKGCDQFPAISGPATATVIDENDYMNFWKDSRKWPRIAKGHPDNPAAFTYITDEKFARHWFGTDYFTPPPQEAIAID